MNIIFADSCRHYPTEGVTYKYSSIFATINANNGRSNGASISLSNYSSELYRYFKRTLATSYTTLGVGFRFRQTTEFGSGIILSFWDTATEQCAIGCDTSGHLIAYKNDNATVLGTSTNVLTLGVLYHIETKVTINGSTGSIEVRVNGSNTGWLNLTNVDTQQSGNATTNAFMFSNSISAGIRYYCDIFCNADTDFIGEVNIDPILINAAGTNAGWTASTGSNYTCVDEASASETDYVSTATDTVKDSYNFASVSSNATILAAVHTIIAKKEDAGSVYIKPLCISNSVEYLQASVPLPTTYGAIQAVYQLDPDTNAAWTNSAFNAAEFGQEYSAT